MISVTFKEIKHYKRKLPQMESGLVSYEGCDSVIRRLESYQDHEWDPVWFHTTYDSVYYICRASHSITLQRLYDAVRVMIDRVSHNESFDRWSSLLCRVCASLDMTFTHLMCLPSLYHIAAAHRLVRSRSRQTLMFFWNQWYERTRSSSSKSSWADMCD